MAGNIETVVTVEFSTNGCIQTNHNKIKRNSEINGNSIEMEYGRHLFRAA